MEIAIEQWLEPLLKDFPWLAERRSCVQGIVMHIRLWGAGEKINTWFKENPEASDEAIILKCRNIIANTKSTANQNPDGNENKGRAFNEPEIALRICEGKLNVDDIEQWVRTKDYSYVGFQPK